MIQSDILLYAMHPDVVAFSTRRDAGTFTPMEEGRLPFPVLCGHQVHGVRIGIVDRPDTSRDDWEGYDALITALPGYAIGVRTADCVPVLLYDPVRHVAAAIHAGWRGTVGRITQRTIRLMALHFDCRPCDLIAQIGPSIGLDSFQVGSEVVQQFADANFPMERIHRFEDQPPSLYIGSDSFSPRSMQGGHHIDLWEANRWLLIEQGLLPSKISVAGIDTYTDNDWLSARREGIACGRIINAIRMN